MNKKDILIKLAIVIGIIIVINVISKRVFTRVDITKNNSYTLSPISKEVVSTLDDNLLIKAYFSDNLPAPYNNVRRQVQDILDDYRSYSKGNMNYEFLNPTSSGEGEGNELDQEAQKFGIQPVQIQAMDNDKLEVKRAYLGLVLLYEGKQEVIPVVQNADNLEYELTSLIKKMISTEKKKVGFLTGHGETELSKLAQINAALSAQYEVTSVNLNESVSLDPEMKVLIVMAPSAPFSESDKYKLDQFVMNGGNVAFLMNRIVPNFQQQQMVIGNEVTNNIEDLLLNYGIRINTDLVRDLQCSPVQVQSAIGFPISVNYPFFPVITDIARDNPAFKNIKSVVLTYSSTIDTGIAAGKNLKINPLLVTSDKSGLVVDFFFLNLEQFQNMTKQSADTMFDKRGFLVGATYEGQYKSFYEGKEMPSDTLSGWVPLSGERLNQSRSNSKIIAIGDGDFANEENKPPRENIVFFINMVDYLMDDVGLAEIRTKMSSESPIEETSEETKKFLKYFNLIFPPALILLIGLYKWNQRKQKKKNLQKS
ncbi:MAG TPA: Gldg family protein [Ignavibacteria bacterium]|nr:Gldg family protein [Ignavibacteria bacterium]HQY51766.1 Gldg family protein [Ignavibacteria bacterium]HRA99371.1 Gldg family protein [Ignavibacteria bacterium]